MSTHTECGEHPLGRVTVNTFSKVERFRVVLKFIFKFSPLGPVPLFVVVGPCGVFRNPLTWGPLGGQSYDPVAGDGT
jgi:hypothetical protein